MLFADPSDELRVLPAKNRRQGDEQGEHPNRHEHEEDASWSTILHVVNVGDAPVPKFNPRIILRLRLKVQFCRPSSASLAKGESNGDYCGYKRPRDRLRL